MKRPNRRSSIEKSRNVKHFDEFSLAGSEVSKISSADETMIEKLDLGSVDNNEIEPIPETARTGVSELSTGRNVKPKRNSFATPLLRPVSKSKESSRSDKPTSSVIKPIVRFTRSQKSTISLNQISTEKSSNLNESTKTPEQSPVKENIPSRILRSRKTSRKSYQSVHFENCDNEGVDDVSPLETKERHSDAKSKESKTVDTG